MKYLVLLLLTASIITLFGCSSTDRLDMVSTCPRVETGFMPGVVPSITADEAHQARARLGCVKFYGEGACLVKFTKTGPLSYQAICRSKPQ